jgi:hypothetical protein
MPNAHMARRSVLLVSAASVLQAGTVFAVEEQVIPSTGTRIAAAVRVGCNTYSKPAFVLKFWKPKRSIR